MMGQLPTSQDKLGQDAKNLGFHRNEDITANPQGLSLMKQLEDLERSQQDLKRRLQDLERRQQDLKGSYQDLQQDSRIRLKLLMDQRERALSTWVRDFYNKDTIR